MRQIAAATSRCDKPPRLHCCCNKSPALIGRDTRCDKSLRHVVATGCCNKSPRVTCENHCGCDRILSLRSVAHIQTGLNSCDISQRQTKRKRLVALRSSVDNATCRRDVSQRFVASCVSALFCRCDMSHEFKPV